jgi:hypothetical protein
MVANPYLPSQLDKLDSRGRTKHYSCHNGHIIIQTQKLSPRNPDAQPYSQEHQCANQHEPSSERDERSTVGTRYDFTPLSFFRGRWGCHDPKRCGGSDQFQKDCLNEAFQQ